MATDNITDGTDERGWNHGWNGWPRMATDNITDEADERGWPRIGITDEKDERGWTLI